MSNAFNNFNNPNQTFQQRVADQASAQHQQQQFQRQQDGSYARMTQQQMQNTQMQQPKINSPMYPNYPGLQPNGYPPNNQPYPGISPWQGMDSFNKFAEDFKKSHDELRSTQQSKELVNQDEVLSATNYLMLQESYDDVELNKLYFSNPDYVWSLFNRILTRNGLWMGKVFAIINTDNVLIFTTPALTMRVSMKTMVMVYKDSQTKPLNKTQILSGLVPILQFIEKVYTEDEERKRQEELERLSEIESEEVTGVEESTDNATSEHNNDTNHSCSCDSIRLHTRKIKNPKANFSKFVKKVSDSEPSSVQYLYKNVGVLTTLIRDAIAVAETKGLRKVDLSPCVTKYGIHLIDSNHIIANINGLYIDFTTLPESPLIEYFEYADLNDPRIIAATIDLCKELNTLIGSN